MPSFMDGSRADSGRWTQTCKPHGDRRGVRRLPRHFKNGGSAIRNGKVDGRGCPQRHDRDVGLEFVAALDAQRNRDFPGEVAPPVREVRGVALDLPVARCACRGDRPTPTMPENSIPVLAT